MTQENPVAKPSKHWAGQAPIWELGDTLFGGTRAMRAAARAYLPQEPAEPEAAYFNRVSRSVLSPFYPDAIRKLAAKPLKKPIILNEDVPAQVLELTEDVDAAGTDIDNFAKSVSEAALNHGVAFILVDSPDFAPDGDSESLNRAQARALGVRPYAVLVRAPQVLGWKTAIEQGQVVLTQVRIKIVTQEDVADPQDEFSQEDVHRIHVWEIGRVRIYRLVKDADGNADWKLESDTTNQLTYIPLIPVYGSKVDFMLGEPPLLDVAYLNVAHWQSDSDQRNILHVARVPLLFGSGLGDEERGDFQIQVGPNTMTRGPQGSDMKFVEHSGKGIDAGRQDLETLEGRMAKLGLNMVIRRAPGDVTATSRALDQSEADSPLGMYARSLEQALNTMLDYFADFLGLGEDAGGTCTVFKDFSISMRDGEDIKALAAMRTAGDISQRTYWEELKRRGLLHDDFDAETEIDLLDLEYQDSQPGMTGLEEEAANEPGDETGVANGHIHVLQADGFTDMVDGHQHRWEPAGRMTSVADGHSHPLRGIPDEAISSERQQDEGTPPAGAGEQVDQPPGT